MSAMFWPFVFLVIGLLLLVMEVFIPSGGLIGLCSVICLALCLWYAFSYSAGLGLTFMLIDLVALPLTVALAFSLWSRTPLGRKFFLKPPEPEEIAVSHTDQHLESLVGQLGRALTPLRPSGHVEIGDRRLDALAEEGFVPEGSPIRVLRIKSGQLVVRGALDSADALAEQWRKSERETRPEPGPSPIELTAEAVSILEELP